MSRNGFVFRLVGALLLIGLMAGGGYMAYHAGVAQGISQAPEVAKAISQVTENGQAVPIPPMVFGRGYGYAHGYPYGFSHHLGFLPFGGICFSVLFLFLLLGSLKMFFFRPWSWRHYGPWAGEHGHPWGSPPWMSPEGEGGEKKEETPKGKN